MCVAATADRPRIGADYRYKQYRIFGPGRLWMRVGQLLLAVMLTACVTLPAKADVNVYYHVGAWDAFDGPGDNGQPVCGVGSRNSADGHTFSLRFQIGGDDLTFIAAKPGWSIPDGMQIPVVMQIGLDQPWSAQAVGKGDHVQWVLDREGAQFFDSQFRRAASMTVTFPSGNEPPWVISLAGSTAVSNAMGRCVGDLTQRAAAAQPAAQSPPTQQGATQPFGTAPTTEDNPPPAQPQPQPTQPGAAPNPAH
jgi:hypothetical protein